MNTKLSKKYTVADYYQFKEHQDKNRIIDIINRRFSERYIEAIDVDSNKKSGFTIMAICCLMIETLMSFREGLKTTERKSREMFKKFFTNNDLFNELSSYDKDFYKHIRCGILHQAETTNGWKIIRTGPLFEISSKTINATRFLRRMKRYLQHYLEELNTAHWDDEIWKNAIKKLDAIADNCKLDPSTD